MWKCGLLCLLLVAFFAASAQQISRSVKKAPRKAAVAIEPECAKGAICFEGEVREGHVFRRAVNAELEFVLSLPGGIDVLSRYPDGKCNLSSWIANPPLMAHHPTEIDAGYDWTAEDEVEDSLREFKIVENCTQFGALYELIYVPGKSDSEKYLELLRGTPGRGRMWITGARVSHDRDSVVGEHGAIEWLKFAIEIRLSGSN